MGTPTDLAIRRRAFDWLAEQVTVHGDVLDWSLLLKGFEVDGARVPLVSQQGIFKPAVCELPLSIRTSPKPHYPDHFVQGRLVYSYRGTDPGHRDNVGLRRAMEARAPLVYFDGCSPGRYSAAWPVFVIEDDPVNHCFWVQADDAMIEFGGALLAAFLGGASTASEGARREYATRLVQQRLHQRGFRERVLDAYRSQCAMCRLRHRDLLDAAHIKPDSAGGQPVVPNGLSLCRIHHGAFDIGVLGVKPDSLRIQVRHDILEEIDGPMLEHGIQNLNGHLMWTPRAASNKPDPEMLRWKWERFQRAG